MDDGSGAPFVRPYASRDFDSVIQVFGETASPALRSAGSEALHIASYVWARPYLLLSLSTCFVLDDGSGTAVGYIIGVPDTAAFIADWERRYIRHLQSEGLDAPDLGREVSWAEDICAALRQLLYRPDAMLHADVPELVQQYPAHLHVDILPVYQQKGYGRRLMDMFCRRLVQEGVKGVHLIMAGENAGAGKFYAKVGFGRFPGVIDGGGSGEEGRDARGSIWLVKTL